MIKTVEATQTPEYRDLMFVLIQKKSTKNLSKIQSEEGWIEIDGQSVSIYFFLATELPFVKRYGKTYMVSDSIFGNVM